jgi:hypothetical protein
MTGLERLSFSNGRLLDAADLRLEQHYHILVRRLLNRGLFTPGVVNGLEVAKKDTRTVTVQSGLALDPAGRELFSGDAVDVPVPNQPPLNTERAGYFLTLLYGETDVPGDAHPCAADGATPEPGRVVETPRFEWTEDWPDHTKCGQPTGRPVDCGIVIALVTLDKACQIAGVETAFREYAYPSHLSQVQSLAIEGEKDIDSANAKVLRFQVRGGNPSSVLLYLWGTRFSSLYYSELGEHTHGLSALSLSAVNVDLGAHTHDLGNHTHGLGAHTHPIAHTHDVGGAGTAAHEGGHRHALKLQRPSGDKLVSLSAGAAFDTLVAQPNRVPFMPNADGEHSHSVSVSGATTSQSTTTSGGPSTDTSGAPSTNTSSGPSPNSSATPHTHSLSASTIDETGNGDPARVGNRLGWIDGLRVKLDGVDITQELLDRFLSGWGTIGNGQESHPLNEDGGTGPLNLLALGRRIDQGPHSLALSVANGGGQILYNLYVS